MAKLDNFFKKIFSSAVIAVLLLALPAVALAGPIEGAGGFQPDQPPLEESSGLFLGILGCSSQEGFLCILQVALRFLLTLAFTIAVIFIVIGGYRYVTARGNEEAAEEAKKTLFHAVVGVILIAAAWIILAIILNLFETGSPG